jgi:hypothetical protein
MTVGIDHPAVHAYLARLEAAMAALSPVRREELRAEIVGHLSDALGSASPDDATVLGALDRLGPPEDIVAAEADGAAAAAIGAPALVYGPAPRRPGTGLELAAVLLLTVGSLVPVAGWLTGVVLLWVSKRWRVGEKVLGTLVVPGGPLGLTLAMPFVLVAPPQTCTSTAEGVEVCQGSVAAPWIPVALAGLWVLLPVVVAVWLYRVAVRRAAAEPAVVGVPAGPGLPVTGRREGSPWGGLEIGAVLALTAGAVVVPVVGPLVGIVLAWMSRRWTRSEKWIATAIAAVPALLVLVTVVLVLGLRLGTD